MSDALKGLSYQGLLNVIKDLQIEIDRLRLIHPEGLSEKERSEFQAEVARLRGQVVDMTIRVSQAEAKVEVKPAAKPVSKPEEKPSV